MLTISKSLSAGQARTYHSREFTSERQNYWSRDQQGHSEWQGSLAKEWGLHGNVGAEEFARLSEGRHPANDAQLVKHQPARTYENQYGKQITSSEHRARWDATFSAPKSVSLTALVGGDDRVREAHRESVRVALQELERYTQARIGNVHALDPTGKPLMDVSSARNTGDVIKVAQNAELRERLQYAEVKCGAADAAARKAYAREVVFARPVVGVWKFGRLRRRIPCALEGLFVGTALFPACDHHRNFVLQQPAAGHVVERKGKLLLHAGIFLKHLQQSFQDGCLIFACGGSRCGTLRFPGWSTSEDCVEFILEFRILLHETYQRPRLLMHSEWPERRSPCVYQAA